MPLPLSRAALASLPPEVNRPSYDPDAVSPGIVHFGVGGFHRAHQAVAVDALMNAGLAHDWGIVGVGVLPADATMRDDLARQDHLYTLVERDGDGASRARVIGSVLDMLHVPDDPEAVLALLSDPQIRIVSLTVTEGGYNTDVTTGEFLLSTPAIAADLAPGTDAPRTVFGLVVEALARRRAAGTPPFTVLSCDNIPENGKVAANAFLTFAEARDPVLAEWIREHVTFPSTMVDRITPALADQDLAYVEETFGIADARPVMCEPFFQWVIEDDFVSGRPPFERSGAQMVADVEPYEFMKLRLLNVSYVGIAHIGFLRGYRLAYESAQDPLVAAFVRRYMDEATPSLPSVPGIDLDAYKDQLIHRFANEYLRDTLARLCMEASDRLPTWLVPALGELLDLDLPVTYGAAIVAAWARYAEGIDEEGEPYEVVDRLADTLVATAREQRRDPLAFLRQPQLFGDLVERPAFTEPYVRTLDDLHHRGAARTLETLGGQR